MSQYVDIKMKYPLIPYMMIIKQVNITDGLSSSDAEYIIEEISNINIKKLLEIIDLFHIERDSINSSNIPIGGEDRNVLRMVPNHLTASGIKAAQLGLKLTNNANKRYDAHRKFGQHYGDLCCLLGLAKKGKITSGNKGYFDTALGNAFKKVQSIDQQIDIIRYLLLSIPIIQYALYLSKSEEVNIYSIMTDDLSYESKGRRGHTLSTIFKMIDEINDKDLSLRISNIKISEENNQ